MSAIQVLLKDPRWLATINAARSRKSKHVGAKPTTLESWCDEAGVTVSVFRDALVGELRRRGGNLAAAKAILEDNEWREWVLAARARTSGSGPVPRTL